MGLTMSSPITPRYLLEGAVYALEQCGLLLRDSNLLYRNGSYASAVAMAAFAREELGRWIILLDLREKVLGGEPLTIKDVQVHCEGHVIKQKAGMLSTTLTADNDSVLGKLLQICMEATAGSKEGEAANEQVEKRRRQKEKRVPDDRHKQRMSALYVEAVALDRWNRPAKEISRPFAREFLQATLTDYNLQRMQRYTDRDPKLFNALVQWSDRPEMPLPEWPACTP
jgi:AbiV family abortive infection protein